jgi:hypothetical protein
MILSFSQIQDVLALLKKHQFIFIAKQLGLDYLSQSEINILTTSGIDITKFTNSKGVIEHAFLFGILSEALDDDRTKKMNYADFQRFVKSANFVPLTEEEEFALKQIKNRAYTDITGLGNRIATGTSNVIIRANTRQQNAIRKIIKDKAVDAIKYRKSATQLASELGNATEDWERDWLRIATYLSTEAYNQGRAQSIFKNHGGDAEVYVDVLDGACPKCRELYLTDPDDPDSEPKTFKLSDIISNGNNIGRKSKELLPVVPPAHPYCRCDLKYKKPGYAWDNVNRTYNKPKKYVPKNKKLQGVKLNINVKKG